MPKLILATEAAEVLGLDVKALYRFVRKGIFPDGVLVRIGQKVRFYPPGLKDWILAGGCGLGSPQDDIEVDDVEAA